MYPDKKVTLKGDVMKLLAKILGLAILGLALASNVQAAGELYFPHVATTGDWKTEIGVINTSNSQPLDGVIKAYDDNGVVVANELTISLAANGRRQMIVSDEYTNSDEIGYMVFEITSGSAAGYTKFWIDGIYRAAVPATSAINAGDIFISHIASNPSWCTGISILNTTAEPRDLTIEFDNGTTESIPLSAKEHKKFLIKDLFNNIPQTNIGSAVIKNASGIIGLELFESSETSGNSYLSGMLLSDDTTSNIYYPHIASDATWWTGIVAYNPSESVCMLEITPYSTDGTPLTAQTVSLNGKEKYIGSANTMNFPPATAWFQIAASSPISGFELFGTNNGKQLAGHTGVNISGSNGVFAKIEDMGWTGIAFVNTENSSASVQLMAYNDDGNLIDIRNLNLNDHQKMVGLAQNFFYQDISDATYIKYSSDKEVVGFQLNGSTDGMMLDALEALPAVAGSADLTYPIVDTNLGLCYDNCGQIDCPAEGNAFYGQDAQYTGTVPSYTDNEDGTVTDNVTGLVWTQDLSSYSMPWSDASIYCESLTTGGFSDWRLPTVKELWSIRDFSQGMPWVDTDYFYLVGDGSDNAQHHSWTSTLYLVESEYQNDQVQGDPAFIVNDWSGHIKAMSGNRFVRAVRGTTSYGINDFVDNDDGTVTDNATGLMWSQDDNGAAINWEAALAYAEAATTAGYDDWRLPNIKELQSIADYSGVFPAMDTSVFNLTELTNVMGQTDYPFYWSSTSNPLGGMYAWFLAFGYNTDPTGYDLHGAGSVCFDTKSEECTEDSGLEVYYNYVRLVRGGDVTETPDGDPSTVDPDRIVSFPDGDTGGGGGGDIPPGDDSGPDFSPGVEYLETIGITVTAQNLEAIIGGPPAPTASEVVANFEAYDATIIITEEQAQALIDTLNLP